MRKTGLGERRLATLFALTAVLLALFAVSALAATQAAAVKDNFFSPKRVTVTRGSSITWRWLGSLRHNVTVKAGPARFRSRTQARGTFTHTFTRKGTYTLYCTIHPFMKMTVVVK